MLDSGVKSRLILPPMVKALECRIPPLALVLLFAIVMWLLNLAFPEARISIQGAGWLAAVIAILGCVTAALGVIAFRQAETTVDPRAPEQTERIVSTGIYRVSRNPMYVGFFLFLLAWATYLQQIIATPVLALFVAYLTRFQIVPEEQWLLAKFGEVFTEYCGRTRRWV